MLELIFKLSGVYLFPDTQSSNFARIAIKIRLRYIFDRSNTKTMHCNNGKRLFKFYLQSHLFSNKTPQYQKANILKNTKYVKKHSVAKQKKTTSYKIHRY